MYISFDNEKHVLRRLIQIKYTRNHNYTLANTIINIYIFVKIVLTNNRVVKFWKKIEINYLRNQFVVMTVNYLS